MSTRRIVWYVGREATLAEPEDISPLFQETNSSPLIEGLQYCQIENGAADILIG
jgi:hypothetical protein